MKQVDEGSYQQMFFRVCAFSLNVLSVYVVSIIFILMWIIEITAINFWETKIPPETLFRDTKHEMRIRDRTRRNDTSKR